MTYRERREARAERRLAWAAGRRAKAQEARASAHAIADTIPLGQPILVGHHSEAGARRDQARIHAGMDRFVEHLDMAARHEQAASTIHSQLAQSIYNDDPDAAERLRERIAALEAERERIKAYNTTCRKGRPDPTLLDDAQRASLEMVQRVNMGHPDGSFPGYALTNLSGNIARQRDRLSRLGSSQ